MFKARAEFREDVEVGAGVLVVREFFGDLENFVRLMPGVESIREEAGGVVCWTVCVDVGLAGKIRGQFRIVRTDDRPQRIEWGPAIDEKKNLLRYAASFEELAPLRTLVRVAERVELRRQSATELHLMAGLIGERRISAGMQERVASMMKTFLKRARAHLEAMDTD
jgi:carbon monoxide dehydrogenase subunit G